MFLLMWHFTFVFFRCEAWDGRRLQSFCSFSRAHAYMVWK